MIEKRRRIEPAQCAIERERRQREGPAEALARHDLEDIARADVFLRTLDDVEIFVMRHIGVDLPTRSGRTRAIAGVPGNARSRSPIASFSAFAGARIGRARIKALFAARRARRW